MLRHPLILFILFFVALPLIGASLSGCQKEGADVINVIAMGDPFDYTFAVTVRSPDTGCEKYADWWEVLAEDGTLIYRRIHQHSHVDDQPFTRSGGHVEIDKNQHIIIRAHMNHTGYGGQAMSGTVQEQFSVDSDIDADFAPDVENQEPLPTDCAF